MPPVQAVEEPSGLPLIQSAVDLHSPADPLLKGGCDIDTDMGDLIIGHDGIAAAAHDDEVLLLRHIAKQIALVKEYRIPLGQAMITAELPEPLPQSQLLRRRKGTGRALADLILHLAGISRCIMEGIFFCVQPF